MEDSTLREFRPARRVVSCTHWLLPLLVGCMIVGGLFYLLDLAWKSETADWRSPVAPPSDPRAIDEQPAVDPGVLPPSAPTPSADDEGMERRQRERLLTALNSRRKTCEYWTQENTQGQFEGLQTTACKDWRALAAQLGVATEPVQIRQRDAARAPANARAVSSVAARADVPVHQCTEFVSGSIAYRNCRNVEKRRLDEACRRSQWQANNWRVVQG